MMSRSVDWPQPLGPTRQTNSPSNTVSDTFSKASTETLSTTSLEWAGLGWTRWSAKTGDPPLEQEVQSQARCVHIRGRASSDVYRPAEAFGERQCTPVNLFIFLVCPAAYGVRRIARLCCGPFRNSLLQR